MAATVNILTAAAGRAAYIAAITPAWNIHR
jgi:hypothetical protein